MEFFIRGPFTLIIIWIYGIPPSRAQYRDMVCESYGSRNARKMADPGPECDMSERNWCTVKSKSYPEEMIMEVILDNRGVMKRLFGDSREARFLETEFTNSISEAPDRPPPPRLRKRPKKPHTQKILPTEFFNGKSHGSSILSTSRRHGKKIDRGSTKEMSLTRSDPMDDPKSKTKFRDEGVVKRPKIKPSSKIRPSRPNDKAFTRIDVSQATQTMTTTVTPQMTTQLTTPQVDVDEENQFTEPTTTSMFDLNEEPNVTVGPIIGTSEEETTEVQDPLSNVEVATTVRPLKKLSGNESVKGNHSDQSHSSPKIIGKETSESSTSPALDSGDELSYNRGSSGPLTDSPPTRKNSENNFAPSKGISSGETDSSQQPREEFLKGRVEFESRYHGPPQLSRPTTYHQKPPKPYRANVPYGNKRERPSTPPPANGGYSRPSSPSREPNPNFQMEKFPACNSTSELIAPTWAKNIEGKNLIVVNVGSFMQHLHVEECEKDALYRKMFCQRGCRCEQQYRLQKLLVIDPDDECRGIFSDWFRFPSCCVCVCYPSSMQLRSGNRSPRIFDQYDYDFDEYSEDEEEGFDDLDDPFVRHYYGIDLLDEEEDNGSREEPQDLETSASNQRIYKSFTDIDSIDRSYVVKRPASYRDEDIETRGQKWSAVLNLGTQINAVSKVHSTSKPNLTLNETDSIKNKKSRLLRGFNGAVNIKPQIPPRRIPPQRTTSRQYTFPWLNPPSLSVWPSIAMYRSMSTLNKYNLINSKSFPSNIPLAVVSPPPKIMRSTVGTVNTATPPYYNWSKRGFVERITKNGSDHSFVLSRIPRSS